MLEAVSIKSLTAHPRYMWGQWADTHKHWPRADIVGLKLLVDGGVDIEKAADSLGRTPRSIAHRAADTGLRLPPHWREIIYKRRPRTPAGTPLQYPYVVSVRGEHEMLLAVNALVSRGLPDHMRADVCQEIMLALWQGDTSIEELRADKALVNHFIRGARKANYEGGGYALSLDVPMRDGRSWYDVLPDPSFQEDTQ